MNRVKFSGFTDEAADDIQTQIAAVKELGWNSLELRAVNRKNIGELEESEVAILADLLAAEGIEVCALGSTIANWGQSIHSPWEDTLALQDRLIRYMRRLGIGMVRIMSYAVELDAEGRALADQLEPERIRRLEWICKTFLDAGILPLHENCHTFGGMSWQHTLSLLDKIPGLKLVFDTGNPPLTHDFRGEFPYPMQKSWEFYQNVKEFVAHVHIKDAIYDPATKQGTYTFPGEGDGDVVKIVSDLLSRDYDGVFSIEPHMAVVFHDASVQSDEKARYDNFVTYGKKWEALFHRVEAET